MAAEGSERLMCDIIIKTPPGSLCEMLPGRLSAFVPAPHNQSAFALFWHRATLRPNLSFVCSCMNDVIGGSRAAPMRSWSFSERLSSSLPDQGENVWTPMPDLLAPLLHSPRSKSEWQTQEDEGGDSVVLGEGYGTGHMDAGAEGGQVLEGSETVRQGFQRLVAEYGQRPVMPDQRDESEAWM